MRNFLRRLRGQDDGVTATEYGIIAAIIALALLGFLTTFQGKLGGMFTRAGSQMDQAGK